MNEDIAEITQSAAITQSRVSSRVLTALIGIPIVLALVYFGDRWLIWAVCGLAAFSAWELMAATEKSENRINFICASGVILTLQLINSTAQTPRLWHVDKADASTLIAALVIAALVIAVFAFSASQKISLISLALSVLAALYLSLFAFIPILQSLPNGHALLWLTLFCVWTGDTLAYYGGRRFGRTRLTPLSPGKSREGALCGFIGSLLVGALIGGFSALGIAHGVVLGALVGVFAPLGDLAESFWKRELGVKDLGTILPGHGGVLDRCDSLLFAAPAAYFYAKWFLK